MYPPEKETKGDDEDDDDELENGEPFDEEDGASGRDKKKKEKKKDKKKDKKFVSVNNLGVLEDKYLDSDNDPDDKILGKISKDKKKRCTIF